jgi:hypothetical protein
MADNNILVNEQINDIITLYNTYKNLIGKNPKRKGGWFTKSEYNLAIMITQKCNKSKLSYLWGLSIVFSKHRAKFLLKKIINND